MKIPKRLMLFFLVTISVFILSSCDFHDDTDGDWSNPGVLVNPMENQTLPDVPQTRFAQLESAKWLEQGDYRVGEAIPAGEYYLETYHPSLEAFFQIQGNTEGGIRKAYSFFNFCFVQLKEGDSISVKFARMIPAETVPPIQEMPDFSYDAGVYRIGKDIPAGEYYFRAIENGWTLVQVLTDYPEFDNPAARSNSVLKDGDISNSLYMTVNEGVYLSVQGAIFYPKEQAPLPKAEGGRYREGMYLVGRDIEAGQYKITVTDKELGGHYYILSNANWDVSNGFVAAREVKRSKTISVENGQYLHVSRAYFEKK